MVPSQPKAGDRAVGERRRNQKMAKKSKPPVVKSDDLAPHAEAEKTMRLRALRLAKEAADRDAALRNAVAAKVRKGRPAAA